MEKILILDFGSQYTQLIARRVRELHVFSEIQPYHYPLESIKKDTAIKGIILSGGPASVYDPEAPKPDPGIFQLGIPILGICYGLQLIAVEFGGNVNPAARREYGRAELFIDQESDLFFEVDSPTVVWMSHGDHLTKVPPGFHILGHTENSPIAAIGNTEKQIYGIQFHPEVHHTVEGRQILQNFLYQIVRVTGDWSAQSFIQNQVEAIRQQVGSR